MHDNFSRQADLYAKYRPRYPKEMYDFIFEHVEGKDAAWDCGTGSGQVAGYLADHFAKVYATDISPEQMKHAPQKTNIKYINTPAERNDFEDDAFDLITVAQAIHWFNFDAFYNEVNRTAKKGALLAVIGYGMVRVDADINPMIDGLYESAFNRYFNKNRRYVDERYQSIPFPFEEIESPEFSISYQWGLEDMEGYFNSWSAVQKIKEEEGYNPVNEVIARLKPEWNEEEEKEVTFPIFLRLGRLTAD